MIIPDLQSRPSSSNKYIPPRGVASDLRKIYCHPDNVFKKPASLHGETVCKNDFYLVSCAFLQSLNFLL